MLLPPLLIVCLLIPQTKPTPLTDCNPDHNPAPKECTRRGCVWRFGNVTSGLPRCIYRSEPTPLIDCHPDQNPTPKECTRRGCKWRPGNITSGSPRCIVTSEAGYIVSRIDSNVTLGKHIICASGTMERQNRPWWFNEGNTTVNFLIEACGVVGTRLHQVGTTAKIRISGDARPKCPKREKCPACLSPGVRNCFGRTLVQILIEKGQTGFGLQRVSNGQMLFDTRGIPGLTLEPGFTQISTHLPSRHIYGLGEVTRSQLHHEINWNSFGIWNTARAPMPGYQDYRNLAGYHPYYLCIENDGNVHMTRLVETGAVNIALQPDPDILTFRTLGASISIDIPVSTPPSDDAYAFHGLFWVIKVTSGGIIRPSLPPKWALGYHISRYGFKSANEALETYIRTTEAGIPFDSIGLDIDYMERAKPFTFDALRFGKIDKLHEKLKEDSRKLLLTVPAVIPATNSTASNLGEELDIFLKTKNGQDFTGKFLNHVAKYPNPLHPNFHFYWTTLHKELYKMVQFDGIIYGGNEPVNFGANCPKNSVNFPKFNPLAHGNLVTNTICNDVELGTTSGEKNISNDMKLATSSGLRNISLMVDWHTRYGSKMLDAGYLALTSLFNESVFVASRPRFADRFEPSPQQTIHWQSETISCFEHMRYSIINMLESGLFGIFLTGSDICGFHLNANEELCIRWHQLGAFYPFARNHNNLGNIAQDPASLSERTMLAIKDSIQLRYSLLSFFHSELVNSALYGMPPVRPLFTEFPGDKTTRTIDDQFLWGSQLMVAPILDENSTERTVYFPEDRWYKGTTGELLESNGDLSTQVAALDQTLYFNRGQSVLPLQEPGRNAEETLRNPISFHFYLGTQGQAYYAYQFGDSVNLVEYTLTASFFNATNGCAGISLQKVEGHYDGSYPVVKKVWIHGALFDYSNTVRAQTRTSTGDVSARDVSTTPAASATDVSAKDTSTRTRGSPGGGVSPRETSTRDASARDVPARGISPSSFYVVINLTLPSKLRHSIVVRFNHNGFRIDKHSKASCS